MVQGGGGVQLNAQCTPSRRYKIRDRMTNDDRDLLKLSYVFAALCCKSEEHWHCTYCIFNWFNGWTDRLLTLKTIQGFLLAHMTLKTIIQGFLLAHMTLKTIIQGFLLAHMTLYSRFSTP
jgi:hypothetical protein